MHIRQETIAIIKAINAYKSKEKSKQDLIKDVCKYFDMMKGQDLKPQDFSFLKYIACYVGIPQFYDMLESFGQNINLTSIDLNVFSALISESTLHLTEKTKIHKYQKEVYDKFQKNTLNRYFLSASTSFGKTHLVFDIMKKMEYDNILLIFPTIALLSENFEKLLSNEDYSYFKNNYKIHTLSEIDEENLGHKNIFIYTPERFLSYMDRDNKIKQFNFVFIDEIYKIDNEYLIDEDLKENERDTAYRLATYFSLQPSTDVLLAGPYIEFSKDKNSFNLFLEKNHINLLNYNSYEIVNKSYTSVGSKKTVCVDDIKIDFSEEGQSKPARLIKLVSSLLEKDNENTIIYCPTKNMAEKHIRAICDKIKSPEITDESYRYFLEHVKNTFGAEWGLYKVLKNRMAFHHGLVPKYMQKEIIRLFNAGEIRVLASTTTITEGVNTTAKNIIITSAKKESKLLKKFDAKNIAGRAGRFLQHYSGRVFMIDLQFDKILKKEADPIKHKNYDIKADKSDIDLEYTDIEYQNDIDRRRNNEIEFFVHGSGLPPEIFNQYRIISRTDKVRLYYAITQLSDEEISLLQKCITQINYPKIYINLDGFQIFLDLIEPFVKNKKMKFLITNKGVNNTNKHSTISYIISNYLNTGFNGLINYRLSKGDHIDKAVSYASNFVYNLLKYQLVKYLGIFNLLYKYRVSTINKIAFGEVKGFERLISKLEYNAFSRNARIASDYGATGDIIALFEDDLSNSDKVKIVQNLDKYESYLFNRIKKVLES